MTLKRRLDLLRRQSGAAPEPVADPAVPAVRSRLERLGGRAAAPRPEPGQREAPEALAQRLGGRVVAEELILIEKRLPAMLHHGRWPLGERVRCRALDQVHPDALYVDTETTGLAGGAGTLAFMVGLAQVEGEEIRLRQWLITAFAGEAALVAAIAPVLAQAPMLVSYNGKSFDLPLLRDRLRMHRAVDLPEAPHHDLLHGVRRLFGSCWADCRLATTERELLGLERGDDLPGAEAPQAWRDYLAGNRHELARVALHNELDILSLVVLPNALARAVDEPCGHGASAAAAARVWLERGEPERALELLATAQPRLDRKGRLMLAGELKRAGRWSEAVREWELLAERGCEIATEQLAKYHEHVRRDWQRALGYASRLQDGPAVRHRRQRLQRRLGERQGRLDL